MKQMLIDIIIMAFFISFVDQCISLYLNFDLKLLKRLGFCNTILSYGYKCLSVSG